MRRLRTVSKKHSWIQECCRSQKIAWAALLRTPSSHQVLHVAAQIARSLGLDRLTTAITAIARIRDVDFHVPDTGLLDEMARSVFYGNDAKERTARFNHRAT